MLMGMGKVRGRGSARLFRPDHQTLQNHYKQRLINLEYENRVCGIDIIYDILTHLKYSVWESSIWF